jgi:hypothetical protein
MPLIALPWALQIKSRSVVTAKAKLLAVLLLMLVATSASAYMTLNTLTERDAARAEAVMWQENYLALKSEFITVKNLQYQCAAVLDQVPRSCPPTSMQTTIRKLPRSSNR